MLEPFLWPADELLSLLTRQADQKMFTLALDSARRKWGIDSPVYPLLQAADGKSYGVCIRCGMVLPLGWRQQGCNLFTCRNYGRPMPDGEAAVAVSVRADVFPDGTGRYAGRGWDKPKNARHARAQKAG